MLEFYQDLWEIRDRRVDNWPLMNSIWPTTTICVVYVYFAKVLGPFFMKDRKPMELQNLIRFYNVLQVFASAFMFINLMDSGWWNHYSFVCQDVELDSRPNSKGLKMAQICWWAYLSKILDFFDTFFFVAKKKFNHVSYLQIIHHALMPFYGWFLVRFLPGGQETFGGTINAFVHILMYSYYFLSSLGPAIQKYLWWKKYLTMIQMIQFVVVFGKCLTNVFGIVECGYPWQFSAVTGAMMVLFFVMFLNFYIQEYKIKANIKKKIN